MSRPFSGVELTKEQLIEAYVAYAHATMTTKAIKEKWGHSWSYFTHRWTSLNMPAARGYRRRVYPKHRGFSPSHEFIPAGGICVVCDDPNHQGLMVMPRLRKEA